MDPDNLAWQRLHKCLVSLLQAQRSHIAALSTRNKLLEEQLIIQRSRRRSDVSRLKDRLTEAEQEAAIGRMLLTAKPDVMPVMKQPDVFVQVLNSEQSTSEFDFLQKVVEHCALLVLEQKALGLSTETKECTEGCHKGNGRGGQNEKSVEDLYDQVKRMNMTIDMIKCQMESEVNRLLNENKFIWNQLKMTESNYIDCLKGKMIEIAKSNKAAHRLQCLKENLQLSIIIKDGLIEKLQSDVMKLEKDLNNHAEEVSRLSKQLKLFRKSRSSSTHMPVHFP